MVLTAATPVENPYCSCKLTPLPPEKAKGGLSLYCFSDAFPFFELWEPTRVDLVRVGGLQVRPCTHCRPPARTLPAQPRAVHPHGGGEC